MPRKKPKKPKKPKKKDMALSVTFNGTTLFEGLSSESTNWTGTDGVSTEVFQQGTSSEGWIVAKNGNETAIYDYYTANSNTAADMSASDTHLYLHIRCDIAPFIDYLYLGISSTSAGTTNYKDWRLVDNTTAIEWYGEWKTFVIDVNSTANRSNGTVTMTDIRSIRVNVDNSNSGNIRSIENTYLDVCRFGTGITAYESTTTAFDLADIEAISNNSTNKFGVIENIGGVNFARGRITIGDSAGTNYANFTSTDETLVFLDASTSGEAISTGLYQLAFVGNSTNPTVVSVGTKVGTGDAMNGRNGSFIIGETTSVSAAVTMDANVSVDWYGGGFRQLGGLITFDDTDSGDEFGGVSFDGCDQVEFGAAVVRNCNFLNTVAAATSGALLWENGTTNVEHSLFVNNAVAVEVPTLSANMTFEGMEFSGNTYDVRYEGASNYTLNWSAASGAPSIQNAGAGTLTASNTVTLTLTNVVVGSQCAIYADTGGPETAGTELMNETAVSSTVTEPYAYSSSQPIVIRVRKSSSGTRYFPYNAGGTITGDFTLRIDQIEDTIAS